MTLARPLEMAPSRLYLLVLPTVNTWVEVLGVEKSMEMEFQSRMTMVGVQMPDCMT
jgi:hypothetical protein